ncbi:methyltransferase domain-containing protein [Alteromonas sp. ASW11-36]|uniref:Methyltransferase domain-containing protein n=1 Tax=Alteromonas arenosi TaxID=3055817 RepID=A0ABT7SW12_9ALTE|nr:methyltransferase domain-containing protein [Alteromonas sp. ASW11-36]MDM7860356.1 methyltransferase domain-containing protein [Alteromonas sp. ASW11-36]
MKAALKREHSEYPQSWAALTSGLALQQIIANACGPSLRMCFGYHFLKLGNLSAEIKCDECTINHKIAITARQQPYSSIVAKATDLPLTENSIDAVLLANELDFSADPHQILREVDRIITPNGHVIITGLNPFSLDGLLHLLPIKRRSLLAKARYFRQGRVNDWLQLLGFEIIEQRKLAHFSLFLNRSSAPMRWLNRFCQRYLPWSGAAYVIVARKREIPLSLVKPSWRLKPKFSAVGASVRVAKATKA